MESCRSLAVLVRRVGGLIPDVGDADLDLGLRNAGTVSSMADVPGKVSVVLAHMGPKLPCLGGGAWLLVGLRNALEVFPKFWIPASTVEEPEEFIEAAVELPCSS